MANLTKQLNEMGYNSSVTINVAGMSVKFTKYVSDEILADVNPALSVWAVAEEMAQAIADLITADAKNTAEMILADVDSDTQFDPDAI